MGTIKGAIEEGLKVRGELKAKAREELGKRVKAMRAEGLTYATIAQRIGCSETRAVLLASERKWKERRA